ncbi:MAG: guanylate kinase [Lachnospiraceae bacterium]
MGKIVCLMGKSASGKDTIFRKLLQGASLNLCTIIPYTTRPIRQGEKDGETYYFYTEEQLKELGKKGRIIELRSYNTAYGTWKYFTADDGQIKLEEQDYLVIGTLESFVKMQNYFGRDKLIPVYIETEDGLRLERALTRERQQKTPKYAEMCRRFLADEEDFCIEKREAAGVRRSFQNIKMDKTIKEVTNYIKEELCR